jgi:hypothetical protein
MSNKSPKETENIFMGMAKALVSGKPTPKPKKSNPVFQRKEGFYYVHGEGEERKVVIDMPDNSIK